MSGNQDPAEPSLLPLGLYELIVDRAVERRLGKLPEGDHEVDIEKLDARDSHASLADHLRRVVREVLDGLSTDDRLERQLTLCNLVIEALSPAGAGDGLALPGPARRLLAVWPRDPRRAKPERPDTPLALGCLLAGTRLDPSLVSQLRKELASADRVDILCSFIKWSGIRILEDDLRAYTDRPSARLRVLTTSYLGATDLKAVDMLQSLPRTEVRVSYDTHRTRLHAKAYLFHRDTGFGTAYVGSANLSRPALTEGLEWTVKISQYESLHLWDRVAATFETYWEDGEFVRYDPSERPRLQAALEKEGRGGEAPESDVLPFELRPYAFQQEILDRLEAERQVQGRDRHLVVAATGTGKTLIAAFDYRNWCRHVATTSESAARPRLLFVAHREELLRQSLLTFRAVLRDPNFGDILVGGREPEQLDHLFVSIQSYNSRALHELPAERYDYVVVDEFHHAAAPSYERLLDHVRPRVLLGLTATPERSDGLDVLRHFGGHLSAQIRLPDAINRKLLSPFQYFAVTDIVDLQSLQWQRGGYRLDDLDRVYTGNDLRAGLVIDKVRAILLDPQRARGIGFCVSVAHARYMAAKFNQNGIPSESLSAETPRTERLGVQERLRRREINFLFVVDLYNEGVDIPEVDTVLFLRPTESLTVFLQQLGRGLRLFEEKECLTVLDFVGQAHRNFRFDLRYRALLTDPSAPLDVQVEHGFTQLPAGCTLLMERVARQHVLENIRQSLRQTKSTLIRDLRELAASLGRRPTLGEYLELRQVDPEDLYRRYACFSRLCVEAGLSDPWSDPDEAQLTRGLRRIAHIADAGQIERLLRWLDPTETPRPFVPLDILDERRLLMTDLSLWGRDQLPGSAGESLRLLDGNPTLCGELRDLLGFRLSRIDSVAPPLTLPFVCPLALHAPYTRDEVLAALGRWTRERQSEFREGVLHLPEIKADVFFFTLNKTETQFSPTTMYQDYAVNERLFHWQSQSTTSADSPTGRRYVEHMPRGYTILLFGRENKSRNGLAQPFAFLGPARYLHHTGSRPLSITWELTHPLPARLFRTLARLSVA
jgi:superfamily II DNA or RNA helicase/HKD family nuclease